MKHKSDFFQCFQIFYDHVSTHFAAKIKIIRSDNAPEFSDSKCQLFYMINDINHQTSCVNRTQQNFRAERKHRHVLEVARDLIFQSGLPLSFWGGFVMTAVHIINRLPTRVLQFKVPYELLYGKPAEYNHLKAYGCLAVASNPSNNTDKFQPRGCPVY